MSSTVDKALELLNLFSTSHPEMGLSEAARLAVLDKATAHRLLGSLAKHGFVEQNGHSKMYRLGAAPLRLARTREASFPTSDLVEPVLLGLADETGETCHASLIAGNSLATIGHVSGRKTVHVSLDAGERLPFHATASGIACLAFLPDKRVGDILKRKLSAFTDATATDVEEVRKAITRAKLAGYALADQSYEAEVYGIAAPLFDSNGFACGAVAVATPSSRMTKDVCAHFVQSVLKAALQITRSLGVEPPSSFVNLARKVAA